MVTPDALGPPVNTIYDALMPLAPWERPDVLREAMDWFQRQTLRPSCLVVSCDGPPPPELRAVLEQVQVPLKLIIGPGGEGVGPVLARGLIACDQEFVLRIDADDLSLPERSRVQVEAMQAWPELVALSAPILEFIDDPQQPCSLRSVPFSAEQILRLSRWRNPLNHPSVVLRRSAVLAAGNYRSCPGFEDYDLWLRVLKTSGPSALGNAEEPLVLARVGRDHLARRRGLNYAGAELRFLWRCGQEELLPWPWIILIMAMRVPIRLLPSQAVKGVMGWFRQKPISGNYQAW